MHQSFLAYVLEDLQQKGIDLLSCTYVLPSKRSGTFLKRHIARTLTRNSFAPKIMAIQECIAEIAEMQQAASVDLLLLLYKVYKDTITEEPEPFSSFLHWGPRLLQDFNEIDGFLVSAQALFKEVAALEALQHWGVEKEKTPLMKNYLKFWNRLAPLYTAFTSALLAQKKGYAGLLCRTALTHLEAYAKNRGEHPIVFVGFNALNAAESKIMQYFLEQGYGHAYWDIDQYFLDDSLHEAGFFVRKYLREWPYYKTHPLLGVHRSFLSPKTLSVVGAPKSIAQTKYVGQLLQRISTQVPASLEKTALVLADESLLTPMLHAIPASVSSANITMGLPLKSTVLYTFFTSFLQLSSSKTERGWLYRDVLECISNPYTIKLASGRDNFAITLAQDLKANYRLYINASFLAPYVVKQAVVSLLFPTTPPTPLQWISCCLRLIDLLKKRFQTENNGLELEYLYRFSRLFHQLEVHLEKVEGPIALKALQKLLDALAAIETLDFIGEPLQGLQLMGMLESRNLDFETVIITSVNEGILPAGKTSSSFIPFEIKRAYGLPTYKEKDAIYTYHFYRLIQRAKTVYLLYNTAPDVLEGGEKSRLLSQLLTDEAIAPYVTHTLAAPPLALSIPSAVTIPKSPPLLETIKNLAAKGFSPTSLTNYIRDPLEFYKRHVLKIKTTPTAEASIAANTFGTIVHDSLEQLYTPLVGEWLTPEKVAMLQPQIPQVVRQHFRSAVPGVDLSKGRFLLVYNVIVTYLQRFMAYEMRQLSQHQVKLLALEAKYETPLDIPDLDFPVHLKGTLDRVDEVDGMLRIVDYKTGRVEHRHVKLSCWEALITDYDRSKAFQLLCYALLYAKHHPTPVLQAGIYSFKNLGKGFLPFVSGKKNTEIDAALLDTFETYLQQLILNICDAALPFTEKIEEYS